MSTRAILTMLMLPAVLRMAAQMPDVRRYQQLKDFPFVIVSEATVTTPPDISDSLFDAASQGIRFRVNRTELQPSDPFIRIYREQLVPWLRQNDMQLRRVFVRGAASPEGPYWNNVRLARERTRRLIDFLNTELGDSLGGKFTTFGLCDMEPYTRAGNIYKSSRANLKNNVFFDLLFSNDSEKTYTVDVTDQMQSQAHGGVITVVIDCAQLEPPAGSEDSGTGSLFVPTLEDYDEVYWEVEM